MRLGPKQMFDPTTYSHNNLYALYSIGLAIFKTRMSTLRVLPTSVAATTTTTTTTTPTSRTIQQSSVQRSSTQPNVGGSRALDINYKSPQDALNDALNYSEDDSDDNEQSMQDKHGKMEKLMTNMLKGVNDSKYIYPAIAIIIIAILVVLILFQKVAVSTKIIASLLLIIFIAFTVFLNKH